MAEIIRKKERAINTVQAPSKMLLREVSSYAVRDNSISRNIFGNKLLKRISLLLIFFLICGVTSYSIILTLRIKKYQSALEESQKTKEYLVKFDEISKELNKNLYSVINKNNELSSALGLEGLEPPDFIKAEFDELEPVEDKPLLSNQEIIGLLKNITAQTVTSENFQIGIIKFGDTEAVKIVGKPNDMYPVEVRINAILQRIRKLVYDRVIYDKIVIRPYEQDEYGVLVDDRLLFTIQNFDAEVAGTDLVTAARMQAETFHKALLSFNRDYLLAFIKNKLHKKSLENKTSRYEAQDIEQRFLKLNNVVHHINDVTTDFETTLKRYQQRFKCTPSIAPLKGQFSSNFGYRVSPFSGRLAFHSGIDLLAMTGTQVKATADGYVSQTGWYGGYGYIVKINHGYGTETLYGHLSRGLVKKGQFVQKGQVIAKSGNSGLSTGPHLHYEVISQGKYRNPTDYLNLDILTAKNYW